MFLKQALRTRAISIMRHICWTTGTVLFTIIMHIKLFSSSYPECSSPPSITPDSYTTGTETFSLKTTSALLVLKTSLDYEAAQRYYLTIEVVDSGKTPALTGVVSVLVNCNSQYFFKGSVICLHPFWCFINTEHYSKYFVTYIVLYTVVCCIKYNNE